MHRTCQPLTPQNTWSALSRLTDSQGSSRWLLPSCGYDCLRQRRHHPAAPRAGTGGSSCHLHVLFLPVPQPHPAGQLCSFSLGPSIQASAQAELLITTATLSSSDRAPPPGCVQKRPQQGSHSTAVTLCNYRYGTFPFPVIFPSS